jgi:hypothetical protein
MVINDKFRLWLLQLLLIGSSSLQVSCSSNLCKDVFREGYASYRDPKAMSYNPDNNLCYLAGNQTTLSSAIINSLNHCSNSSRSKSQCYLVAMNSLYFGDSYDGNYCQEIDNEFINKPGHKAIAMGFGSGCYSVWSLLTPELAVQKALENCMNSGSTCTIYAIDDIMSNMRIANWGKKNRSTSDAQDKAMLTLLGGFLQGGSSITRPVYSQLWINSGLTTPHNLRHHLLHPLLPDVGVNLGGGDALVAEQGLDVHQFGPGVEQVRGVGVAQFVWGNLLLDARPFATSPAGRRGPPARTPALAGRLGEHVLAPAGP